MLKAIERVTGDEYKVERIEGGYKVFTMAGEPYKKLKESTFKKYFKMTGETVEEKATKKAKAKQVEEKKEAEPVVELSDEKREKMMEKIRKILALAKDNPSMEEGLSAALQAQKLMKKYNIHKEDVELEEVQDEIVNIFSSQKHDSHLKSWRKQLAVIIARNFRCKCFMNGKDVVFRGYKQDAEIALEVYMSLYTICKKLGVELRNKAKETKGTGKGVQESFAVGFLKGVEEGLGEQCTALMIVVPKEVEEDWEQYSADFKKGKTGSLKVLDGEAYEKGKVEGKAAVKARAVEEK